MRRMGVMGTVPSDRVGPVYELNPTVTAWAVVGDDWQQRVYQRLGLKYCGTNGVTPGGPEVRLTSPAAFNIIRGDGNCMFRLFFFIITGSEEQHMLVQFNI